MLSAGEVILQQLMNGLILGSFYALIALGYSMVYGIIKLLNFAHGDIYMTGAFVGFFVFGILAGTVGSSWGGRHPGYAGGHVRLRVARFSDPAARLPAII